MDSSEKSPHKNKNKNKDKCRWKAWNYKIGKHWIMWQYPIGIHLNINKWVLKLIQCKLISLANRNPSGVYTSCVFHESLHVYLKTIWTISFPSIWRMYREAFLLGHISQKCGCVQCVINRWKTSSSYSLKWLVYNTFSWFKGRTRDINCIRIMISFGHGEMAWSVAASILNKVHF